MLCERRALKMGLFIGSLSSGRDWGVGEPAKLIYNVVFDGVLYTTNQEFVHPARMTTLSPLQ